MVSDPLRIAFFGTDVYTKYSLEAVHKYMQSPDSNIERLDVITRPPKRGGRGRVLVKEAPAGEYAFEHDLNVIRAEKDKEIVNLAKNQYNLAIAVSYGKFIPNEFLSQLKYGGLNVHPSLLPSLAGPAPIHHALLNRHAYTGVTVQSMHPHLFDRGRILLQTPEIPIEPDDTTRSLLHRLGVVGADGLVQVLRSQLYTDPEYSVPSSYAPSYAGKLTSRHKRVNLEVQTLDDILLQHRVLGPLHFFQHAYSVKTKRDMKNKVMTVKRLIIDDVKDASIEYPYIHKTMASLKLGEYGYTEEYGEDKKCIIRVKDGFISATNMLIEGYAFQCPERFRKGANKRGLYNTQLITSQQEVENYWKK
ncbi:hypothetical protein TRICI_000661 [Trichomonascus ciferrii]|uniref:methionyl-tRNA formyltransferase n=1 Tax=Trichomonascus ciferrii TaxID=44093 RepID=A0A642VBC8_9ASCO|nr:hypothetical protein TRICI_000661 [Trichomonascus ciferrii]